MAAASFCLPLLVFSSIGTAMTSHCYGSYDCHGNTLKHAAFAIQVIISFVQVAAAITSAGMTCKAVCKCCGPRRESGVVYYNGSGGGDTNNPISQIQAAAASAGATALPTAPVIQDTSEIDGANNSPPPKYESVAKMKEDEEDTNGTKYQRFQ